VRLTDLALQPDLLYLFVFGPGFGESIVTRIPPDEWFVVDSLRRQTRNEDSNPSLELLAAHDATISAIALTHPHSDHARGMVQLLERRRTDGPVGCMDAFSTPDTRWRQDPDASRVLDTASTGALLNRIDHIWSTEPASKWLLVEGEVRTLAGARIEVLHPRHDDPMPRDLNRISSPMLITWNSCRLLLGADLPVVGWRSIAKRMTNAGELAGSHALKVAHHGSKGAQHATAIGSPPPKDRLCVTTPFNRRHHLPSYADGHGIAELLRTHVSVGVTAVPAHGRGSPTPRVRMQPAREHFGGLTLTREVRSATPSNAWIAAAFDTDGGCAGVWYGDAAGEVVA
jgi:Metallo-beta-lactamase superfamily